MLGLVAFAAEFRASGLQSAQECERPSDYWEQTGLVNMWHRLLRSIQRRSLRFDLSDRLGPLLKGPRILLPNARQAGGTWSSRRINKFAELLVQPASYLEVGVEYGYTFEAVQIPNRVAVDPRPRFSLRKVPPGVSVCVTTSDQFFESLDPSASFDVIFLDGLHTYQQTYRDLMNSLRHAKPQSVILVDDVVPDDEVSAMADAEEAKAERARRGLSGIAWQGDVFRLMLVLRDHHPDLRVRTIVDSGNDQAVIWRIIGCTQSTSVSDSTLASYKTISYSDVFSQGVPGFFHPGTEEEVLDDVKYSMR